MRLFSRKMPTGLLHFSFCIKETASYFARSILPSPSPPGSQNFMANATQGTSFSGSWNSPALRGALSSSDHLSTKANLYLEVSVHLISSLALLLQTTILVSCISAPCWDIGPHFTCLGWTPAHFKPQPASYMHQAHILMLCFHSTVRPQSSCPIERLQREKLVILLWGITLELS